MAADSSKSREELEKNINEHYKEITQSAYGLASRWFSAFDGLAENRSCAAKILLHEAYIDALPSFSTFKPEDGPFPAWFFKIMYRVMLGKLRSLQQKSWQQVAPSTYSAVQEDLLDGDPLDSFISPNCSDPQDLYVVLEDVNGAFSSLNARDRTMMYLRAIRDLPGPEIAQRFGCSLNQVHSHLSYIRQHLPTTT